jgi:hypothetical protein
MVNNMVDYLARELDKDTDHGKEALRQDLCDVLQRVAQSKDIYTFLSTGDPLIHLRSDASINWWSPFASDMTAL